jgi:hypothetical protein
MDWVICPGAGTDAAILDAVAFLIARAGGAGARAAGDPADEGVDTADAMSLIVGIKLATRMVPA